MRFLISAMSLTASLMCLSANAQEIVETHFGSVENLETDSSGNLLFNLTGPVLFGSGHCENRFRVSVNDPMRDYLMNAVTSAEASNSSLKVEYASDSTACARLIYMAVTQ